MVKVYINLPCHCTQTKLKILHQGSCGNPLLCHHWLTLKIQYLKHDFVPISKFDSDSLEETKIMSGARFSHWNCWSWNNWFNFYQSIICHMCLFNKQHKYKQKVIFLISFMHMRTSLPTALLYIDGNLSIPFRWCNNLRFVSNFFH